MDVGRFMGYLHPALIHFPIVLMFTAVGLEAVAFFRRDTRLEWPARLLLLLGMVSTLFAFVCGNFAEIWAARSGISQEAMERHELLATVTSWLFVGLTAWRILMRAPVRRVWHGLWLVTAIGACVLLGFTGHHGASLVYEQGAAVQNIGLQRIPVDEDLALLTMRQNVASIAYSNLMHHVFGGMVLLLSLILLLDRLSPRVGEDARRFGPVLLFMGGLFLLIFSDQDAWPLYHVHPFRPLIDKEVLLHKTYAVLMLLIGTYGLSAKRGLFRRQGRQTSEVTPSVRESRRLQDRLIAVFALVGGALLFTHVHSAAPYANVAVGVYIHHTAMGLVALLIGAVKLIEDARPVPIRPLRWGFPALMGLEAVLLLNYNEGLPWFLGYGNLSTVAAHGGLVAPLGPDRAELVYHPDTTRLELYVMRRDSAQPVPLPIQRAQAIVRVGDEATEVSLAANPGIEPLNAHFARRVDFLRGQPLFQVRALVSIDGRSYTADFEPWIDPVQASPHSKVAWICPMHPQVGAATFGYCSICGMALEPNRPPRPAGQLHDPDLQFDLTLQPPQPKPKQPTHLTMALHRTGDTAIIRDLEPVHTKKLHLIIVSRDLSFFDHVHPAPQTDGRLTIDYPFPHPGAYLLFADLTPTGAGNQVFRIPVTVAGPPPAPVSLQETPAPARLFGDYRISLTTAPYPLQAREDAALTFTLSRGDRPITDLQPYLGAAGHCVLISEDTSDYLHCHPLNISGESNGGPQVTFHTRFPRPGLYKVWGQFQHQGRIVIADFVVRVF